MGSLWSLELSGNPVLPGGKLDHGFDGAVRGDRVHSLPEAASGGETEHVEQLFFIPGDLVRQVVWPGPPAAPAPPASGRSLRVLPSGLQLSR